ncbi:MAG: zinc ABC transporter substrate-binding protein [Candidatus Moranbacteria bacterium]|nr:zinc ABC transporter substrate-binding protein [Candidatus Moranbacteria bacterium]
MENDKKKRLCIFEKFRLLKRPSQIGIILVFLGMIVFGFLIFSGEKNKVTSTRSSSNEKEKLQIVASFYPLAFIAERIGGEKVSVSNLAGSRDAHSYQITPSDMKSILEADLFIFHGEGFEPWIENIVPQLENADTPFLSLLDKVSINEEELHEEDLHEEELHEEEHDHSGRDPHIWVDPLLVKEMTLLVRNAFIQIDDQNKEVYEKNTQVLLDQLDKLDDEYRQRLALCDREEVIVSHNAFGYLAKRYDFTTHAIAGISTLDEPSAKLLAQLKEEASSGVTHILTEEGSVTRYAETLSLETGLQMLPINPMGRGTLDSSKDYFDVSRENLQSFALSLGCE